jgi:hypothetical protein
MATATAVVVEGLSSSSLRAERCRCRRCRCRRLGGSSSGDEGRRRGGRRPHVELSQPEISTNVGEGREWPLAGDELGHELEPFVEATQDVEHQGAVLDWLTEVGQGISHAFHLAAIVVDGESTLTEGAKLGVEEHGTRLTVVEELLFKPEPGRPGSGGVVLMDDVQEVGGDGVEDPGQNNTVHA